MSIVTGSPVMRSTAPGLAGVVLGQAMRLVRRGGLIVAVVAAGMSAVVVQQHRSLFGGASGVGSLEALAENPAIRIMFGRPVALDDPGGFTVWRTGTPVVVLVAVWAVLAAIRITRGDEEVGRWDLLVSGRYRLRRLVLLHLAVVAGATVLTAAAVTVAMVSAGAGLYGSVLYGAALALIGVGSAAWGGLTGQLVEDRRRATVLAAAGIGAGLLARMVADSTEWLGWLHWVTPFGLLGRTEPFAADRLAPLVVLLAGAAAVTQGVVLASGRRDLGAGVVPVRIRHRPHLGLLRSLPRFTVRRSLGSVAAWATGVWIYLFVIGLLAASVTRFLTENPVFANLAAQAGFGSLTTVTGYLASLFALLAIPLGLYAASRISAAGGDEEARRLTMVFAAPVSRRRWFVLEAAAALAGTVVLAAGAGTAAWLGAVAVDVDVSIGAALLGALNVLPVAWLSLGAAVVALGWFPSSVLPIGALPVAGGFLLLVLAESLHWPEWVAQLSPFAHLNPVPYENPNWAGTLAMTMIALALSLVGLAGFTRRDLRG